MHACTHAQSCACGGCGGLWQGEGRSTLTGMLAAKAMLGAEDPEEAKPFCSIAADDILVIAI